MKRRERHKTLGQRDEGNGVGGKMKREGIDVNGEDSRNNWKRQDSYSICEINLTNILTLFSWYDSLYHQQKTLLKTDEVGNEPYL